MRILFAAICASAASLLSAAAAAAPLEEHRNRLFLAGQVDGTPVTALLDSGAEMSILDRDFAASLGLRLAGEAEAHGTGASAMVARFAEGVDLEFAGLPLPGQTLAVLDLGEVSRRLVGRPVAMILGRNLFDAARLRIDIAGREVSVVAGDADPPGVRLPLTPHRGLETFPASVEGAAPAGAVFDLGNGSEVMVGRAYAERTGLAAPARIVGRAEGGGLGGAVTRDRVVLATLEIGGTILRDVPAAIDDSASAADLNIGTSVLRHFLITTDFAQGSIWFAPRPKPHPAR